MTLILRHASGQSGTLRRKQPAGGIPILAVYRDAAVRERIRKAIERAGFTPLLAERGREGLDLVRAHQPAAVLLDWFMPDITGTEFETEIRAASASTAVVFTNNWDRAAMVGQILGSQIGKTMSENDLDRVVGLVETLSRQ